MLVKADTSTQFNQEPLSETKGPCMLQAFRSPPEAILVLSCPC